MSAIGPASTQGLSPISFDELSPLLQKAIQLQGDVGSAGRGIATARTGLSNALCFLLLSESLTHLNAGLLRLQTVVVLAEKMRDPYDV